MINHVNCKEYKRWAKNPNNDDYKNVPCNDCKNRKTCVTNSIYSGMQKTLDKI